MFNMKILRTTQTVVGLFVNVAGLVCVVGQFVGTK